MFLYDLHRVCWVVFVDVKQQEFPINFSSNIEQDYFCHRLFFRVRSERIKVCWTIHKMKINLFIFHLTRYCVCVCVCLPGFSVYSISPTVAYVRVLNFCTEATRGFRVFVLLDFSCCTKFHVPLFKWFFLSLSSCQTFVIWIIYAYVDADEDCGVMQKRRAIFHVKTSCTFCDEH